MMTPCAGPACRCRKATHTPVMRPIMARLGAVLVYSVALGILAACAPLPRCRVTSEGGKDIEVCESIRCRNLDNGRFVKCPELEPIGTTAGVGRIKVSPKVVASAHPKFHYDAQGNPVACPLRPKGADPVGMSSDGVNFFCRDAQGREWPSHGECD